MKRIVFISLALFGTFCTRVEDTNSGREWRGVEPRLSGHWEWRPCRATPADGHTIPSADCGAPRNEEVSCDRLETHEQALRALAASASCTDAAIVALEHYAARSLAAKSDLAAAYYVRAQREDEPADMLQALEVVDQVLSAKNPPPQATFNRALILEALGFDEQAAAAWDVVLRGKRSAWSREAQQHRRRLSQRAALDAAVQWTLTEKRIPDALQSQDRLLLEKLIKPFPSTSIRYFEQRLLAEWAEKPDAEQTARVSLFAEVWSRVHHDPYAADIAEAVKRDGSRRASAYLDFSNARNAQQERQNELARALYTGAANALLRAGSPLRLAALLNCEALADDLKSSRLPEIEQDAARHGYHLLSMRAKITHANLLELSGRFQEALAKLDDAEAIANRIGNNELRLQAVTRRIGYAREAGLLRLSLRDALRTVREVTDLVPLNERHLLLGDTNEIVAAFGHPRIALMYHDRILALIHSAIAAADPSDKDAIRGLHIQLAIALRRRAAILLQLDDLDGATRELTEALRIADDPRIDHTIKQLLDTSARIVQAKALIQMHSPRSVAAFTEAIELARTNRYPSYLAYLYTQRAAAYRAAGNRAAAERDLRTALDQVREEEIGVLKHRKPEEHESFFSPYFSRFQDDYKTLIRQLVEEGRQEEALTYVERARAFEPLDLVRQRAALSPDVRQLLSKDTLDIAALRALLPPDRFILEYCVLDDRTYTWVIGRDGVNFVEQPTGKEKIARWSNDLQEAARKNDAKKFERNLYAPFAELLKKPLERVHQRYRGVNPTLVIIPDGPMHGLPFAALRPDPRHYVIHEAILESAGSATLYVVSLDRDRFLSREPESGAFLVGDPAFDPNLSVARGLSRLPGAQREVDGIAALYKRDVVVRKGADATADDFLSNAGKKRIVHIAGHVLANAKEPTQSLILFAPTARHSGVVETEAMGQTELRDVQLVVLSSCSSADGRPVGPEGVAPLVRPLITQGVAAVVGSLWDVNDATTEALFVSFHRHYRNGSNAAAALRSAQLELLGTTNRGLRSPLTWAPFQVYGHASSPFGDPMKDKGEPP